VISSESGMRRMAAFVFGGAYPGGVLLPRAASTPGIVSQGEAPSEKGVRKGRLSNMRGSACGWRLGLLKPRTRSRMRASLARSLFTLLALDVRPPDSGPPSMCLDHELVRDVEWRPSRQLLPKLRVSLHPRQGTARTEVWTLSVGHLSVRVDAIDRTRLLAGERRRN
jgi:hypothetical protein